MPEVGKSVPEGYVNQTFVRETLRVGLDTLNRLYEKYDIKPVEKDRYKLIKEVEFEFLKMKHESKVGPTVPDSWPSISEASRTTSLSYNKIKRYVEEGKIEHYYRGNVYSLNPDDLEELDRQEQQKYPPEGWIDLKTFARSRGVKHDVVRRIIERKGLKPLRYYTDPKTNRPGLRFMSPDIFPAVDSALRSREAPEHWVRLVDVVSNSNIQEAMVIRKYLIKRGYPVEKYWDESHDNYFTYTTMNAANDWYEYDSYPPEGWQPVTEYSIQKGFNKGFISYRVKKLGYANQIKVHRNPKTAAPTHTLPIGFMDLLAETPFVGHDVLREYLNETTKEVNRCKQCKKVLSDSSVEFCSPKCRDRFLKRDVFTRYCISCNTEMEEQPDEPRKAYLNRFKCIQCNSGYQSVDGLVEPIGKDLRDFTRLAEIVNRL